MREGIIKAVAGLPGAGKSLYLAQCVVQEYDEGYRHLITNMPFNFEELQKLLPALTYTHLSNEDIAGYWRRNGCVYEKVYNSKIKKDEWKLTATEGGPNDCPRGSIVVMDEVQLVYDAQEWRDAKANIPDLMEYWSKVRHSGDRVYVASQAFADIILFIRRRCEFCMVCRKFPGKFFMRRNWHTAQGEFGEAASWWKLVPLGMLMKYARLYRTHDQVGATGQRVEAPFVENKALKWRRLVVPVAAVALVAYGVWWMSKGGPFQQKKPAVPVVAAVAPPVVPVKEPSPTGHAQPLVVKRQSMVVIRNGQYDTDIEGAAVEKVDDHRVYVSLPDGRVQAEKRDRSREYAVIRAQRASAGAGFSSGAESVVK